MGKYGISEVKKMPADYGDALGEDRKDEICEKIMQIIVVDKKYRDKNYSASQLAYDTGTNSRYITAVMAERFHINYNGYVNTLRINEAMALLANERYRDTPVEKIGEMVGFANRQTFYASFFRFQNTTPREYRLQHLRPIARKRARKNKWESSK